MRELITLNWRAHNKTISSLKAAGWSDEQRKRKLLLFIERFINQEIENASSRYSTWVREETPRDAKPPSNAAKELISNRAKDLKNKSSDGAQRAQEAKQQDGAMTQDEAITWYNCRR